MPLYRRDLFQMGTVTSRSNLALMPPGKKGQVRVICADDSGQVASLQMVKGVPALSWRSAATTAKVEAVAIGPADAKDKHTVRRSRGKRVGHPRAEATRRTWRSPASNRPHAPLPPPYRLCRSSTRPGRPCTPATSWARRCPPSAPIRRKRWRLWAWRRGSCGRRAAASSTSSARKVSTPSLRWGQAGAHSGSDAPVLMDPSCFTRGGPGGGLADAAGKDLAYAMVPDRITSLCVSGVMRESHVEAVVGCADRAIRIYNVRLDVLPVERVAVMMDGQTGARQYLCNRVRCPCTAVAA